MTPEKKQEHKEMKEESLIRVLSTDIPGNKTIYSGLTKIKGISWNFSNAICHVLKINKNKKIEELTKEEIEKITEFVKNPKVPKFIMNRRRDYDTEEDKHLVGQELDFRKEFDIRKLRKIKCYKGLRHSLGLPVRGQRTKAHFRKGKSLGVKKGKSKKSGK